MSVIGDKITRWCEEESLSLDAQRDDETALNYVIALPGDPVTSITVSASGADPDRVLLTHAFDMTVPAEVRAEEDWRQQVARLVESVAVSRSGLVQCRLLEEKEKPTAEVVVTLHHDGIMKQSFLTALEETRKVRQVIEWGLEGISSSVEILSNARSVVEQTEALASEMSKAAEGGEEPAAAAPPPKAAPTAITPITPPPEAEAEPAAPTPPPPPPEPAPPPAPAGLFCPKCGKQAKPEQRFCIGCGTSLEGQG
jgi:hypothetical protein